MKIDLIDRASVISKKIPDHWKRVMELHFDPDHGSPYWLDQIKSWNLDPLKDLFLFSDFEHVPFFETRDMATRPVEDFIPRSLRSQSDRWIMGETGGLTGNPSFTVYRNDEFYDAFIRPFLIAANLCNFPSKGHWIWIGPSGPHLIGKAARLCAAAQGQPDPFSVDFDPRWARKLPRHSIAFSRYMDHILDQSLRIFHSQNIEIIFTTPVVINKLGEVLSLSQRSKIKGIHYGGMASTSKDRLNWKEMFPNAVLLAGYGNTLFGMAPEIQFTQQERTDQLTYYPIGHRLWFEAERTTDSKPSRLTFSRFDETQLILRAPERDQATIIHPPTEARDYDIHYCGIENPEPWNPIQDQVTGSTGIY